MFISTTGRVLGLALGLGGILLVGISDLARGAPVPGTDVTFTSDADFVRGTLVGVNHDAPNNDRLQLNSTPSTFPFIWIANAAEGTVSKFDTVTGKELGRYRTGPENHACPFPNDPVCGLSPSRTTVDLNGNLWVGNRSFRHAFVGPLQGTATKVGALEAGNCVDRNGNGVIDTARDLNGDGRVTLDEVLAWPAVAPIGQDECILLHVKVGGIDNLPRATCIDPDNNVWIGAFNEGRYYRVDGRTGALLETISTGSSPYGCIVTEEADGRILWSATLEGRILIRRNLTTGGHLDIGLGATSYGLAVDRDGHIWVTHGCSADALARIRRSDGRIELQRFGVTGSCPTGTSATADNHIWTADRASGTVTHLDHEANTIKIIRVGSTGFQGPSGTAADAAGKVWVTHMNDDRAVRIDPALDGGRGEVDGSFPTGDAPYNYSDMTGIIARTITSPRGTWTVIVDSGVPGMRWGAISWNREAEGAEPPGTSIVVTARASDTEAGLGGQTPAAVSNATPFTGILGRFLQTEVTLIPSAAGISPILSDIRIRIENQPPACASATASPSTLWPPHHKLVPVSITGVTDPDGRAVSITATSVFQDEQVRDVGAGSGHTAPDATLSPLAVRAERSGSPEAPGNGRVYHIGFTAADDRGGSCQGTVTVCVPHDARPDATCLDDRPLHSALIP
jgi:DNA-binding beta-propeller fold protein YncE